MFIADAAAHGGQVQRGKGIQETCGQPAQTAVAESRIVFLLLHLMDIHAHIVKRRFILIKYLQVDHVVDQCPPMRNSADI